MAIPQRGLLITNPIAGTPGVTIEAAVLERCESTLEHLTAMRTSARDGTVSVVTDAVSTDGELDLVIAAGGDGTIREVAEGLARGLGRWPDGRGETAKPRLCLLPAGSGNSAYYELWGRRRWQETLDVALGSSPTTRSIDLVRIVDADRGSLLGVNVGLIAHIAKHLERRKRDERRRSTKPEDSASDDQQRYWAAFGDALQTFQPFPVRVTADGDVLFEGTVMMVTVGGVRSFGRGNFQLLPYSVLDDGLLDVCVVREVGHDDLVRLAQLVPTGRHVEQPEVVYAQCEQVTLERLDGRALALEHDGDPRTAARRVDLCVARGAVPMVVPH